MAKTLLMSGFDVRVVDLPAHAKVIAPPRPLPPLDDFRDAIARALEHPVAGPPLSDIVKPGTRVCIAIDDFTLPVPPAARDCRREMLEVVLRQLGVCGVKPNRISVLVLNGLSRQWRMSELNELLGPQAVSAQVASHDAEAFSQLARLGDCEKGPIDVNRSIVEAELVIHLNLVTLPLQAGLFPLASGGTGYRTARWLHNPATLETENAPLRAGSTVAALQALVAGKIEEKVRVFQVSTVLSNDVWAPAFGAVLQSQEALARPLQVWNALPASVRHRAARLLKASYRPLVALAGAPKDVAPKALEVFQQQHVVSTQRAAKVLLFGLPDQGPFSVGTAQNPILVANLALGYVANLFTREPLLAEGGVIIFANPMQPVFDRRVHGPHEDFYEKVLRLEREPIAIHEKYEPFYSGRPEYVSGYQRRFAFHGAHPLFAWYQCWPARRRAGRIIVAYGDPRACARLGFTPANDVDDALKKAREFLGEEAPETAVLELPPPYWVRIG